MILKPFVSGFDNLSQIFDKNMRAYNFLCRESPTQPVTISTVSPKNKKDSTESMVQTFFVRFIRFHGDLFKLTQTAVKAENDRQKEKRDTSPEDSNPDETSMKTVPPTHNGVEFDVEGSLKLAQKVLSDFEYCMHNDESAAMNEILLVRLLAICLFSVHHAASLFGEDPVSTSNVTKQGRSVAECLALHFLFNFISRYDSCRIHIITVTIFVSSSVCLLHFTHIFHIYGN